MNIGRLLPLLVLATRFNEINLEVILSGNHVDAINLINRANSRAQCYNSFRRFDTRERASDRAAAFHMGMSQLGSARTRRRRRRRRRGAIQPHRNLLVVHILIGSGAD